MPDQDASGEFSLTVSRALALLSCFSAVHDELGVTELSAELGISKAATSRLLQALKSHQFLEQNPENRKYRIGVEAFRVGNLFAPGRSVEDHAADVIQALVRQTTFTCYISLMRRDAMVLTTSVEGTGRVRYSIPVGTRMPLHCSATGKAALSTLPESELDEILARTGLQAFTAHTVTDPAQLKQDLRTSRERGYSLNWEETNPGIGSVAAPILGRRKELLAVLSIGFATSQLREHTVEQLGALVTSAAAEVARRIANGGRTERAIERVDE